MFAKPLAEHQWLEQLLGEWLFENECSLPDGSKSISLGSMSCRSLGGHWVICEGSDRSSDKGWSSIMSLGYDPVKNRYVGTFVASMMPTLWLYEGARDSTGNCLSLETEGPKFVGEGTCKYRDTIEIVDKDTWLFNSAHQRDDGAWVAFMSGRNTRAQ